MPTPAGSERGRGPLVLLVVCVAAAATATAALDRYEAAEQERQVAGPADRSQMAPPDPARWRAAPLTLDEPAPGFDLADVRTGDRVSLAGFRGRPVVVLLSSFGCNVFCGELGRLADLSRKYKDRAPFLFVAIRDAGHPDPITSPPAGGPRPGESGPETRMRLVREGAEFLALPFPTLLDADGEAERAYDAFPKRLVVVGADGRVVYDGGRGAAGGPSDWDLGEVESRLRAALARDRPAGPGLTPTPP